MPLFGKTTKTDENEALEALTPVQAENNALYLGACSILGGMLASNRFSGLGTPKLVSMAVANAEKVMEAMFDEAEDEELEVPAEENVSEEKTS